MKLRFGSWTSTDGAPYPQSVVFEVGNRFFVVGNGGGGGAAQMLPAGELEDMITRSWEDVREIGEQTQVADFLSAVDARVATLEASLLYRGTCAHAVVASWHPPTISLGGVGLCQTFLVRNGRAQTVLRAESLLTAQPDQSVVPAFAHTICVNALGRGNVTEPITMQLRPRDHLFLVSDCEIAEQSLLKYFEESVIPSDVDSIEVIARDLWFGIRQSGLPANKHAYDRTAALGLIIVD